MCVVGEWDGDTAEPAFTAQLLAGFRLVDRCALPNWTDSAHELTVWERRTGRAQHGVRGILQPPGILAAEAQ